MAEMTLCIKLAAFNQWNDERNVNVNRNDNDWNGDWWFAGLRNSLYFSALWRSFYLTDLSQPPNIFPTSFNFSERFIYFLLSKAFISHATCRKNFSKSSLTEARLRKISFSALSEYPAFIIFSITSKNKPSIFCPNVWRESFGKSGKKSCHNL